MSSGHTGSCLNWGSYVRAETLRASAHAEAAQALHLPQCLSASCRAYKARHCHSPFMSKEAGAERVSGLPEPTQRGST